MSSIRYSKTHEWVSVEGGLATVGITAYAAEQLGDVVYVEPAEVGRVLAAGDVACTVESVKAASEIYTPVGGTITEANTALGDVPGLVNEHPTAAGWLFKLTLTDPGELDGLLDQAAYQALVAEAP